MIEHSIWVEKYRPTKLDDYIGNEQLKEKVKIYIANGDIPHLLLVGPPGTGKTTLAKLLAKNTNCEYLYINASSENSVDVMRTKIQDFVSTTGFAEFKLVILDEADFCTPNAQAALRNLMETFSRYARFILTANYAEKVIEPIQSRCQVFKIVPPNKREVAERVSAILDQEGVTYALEDVVTLVLSGYPDIRRIINSAQRQNVQGALKIDRYTLMEQDYKLKLIEHLKSDTKSQAFTNIRQLLADAKVQNYSELYKLLYDTIDEWGKGHLAPCILLIADAQATDAFAPDKEIHVMALVVRLLAEIKTK